MASSDNIKLLMTAARTGDRATALRLVLNGVDVNCSVGEVRRCTPLHLACREGHKHVAQMLLENGALLTAVNKYQHTALHIACGCGHKDVVEMLLAKGAFVDAVNKDQHTPLHLACCRGHKDVAEMLLAKGALVDALSKDQYTPLHLTCFSGFKDVAEILLQHGALTGAVNKYQNTPLHLACLRDHRDVVKMLLEKGACLESINKKYRTPLHMACHAGNKDVAEILLKSGARMDAKDEQQWTPLLVACIRGHKDVVEMLLENSSDVEGMLEYGASLHTITPITLSFLPEAVREEANSQRRCATTPVEEERLVERVIREKIYLRHLSGRLFRSAHANLKESLQYLHNSHGELSSLIERLPLEMVQHVLSIKLKSGGIDGVLSSKAISHLFRISSSASAVGETELSTVLQ